MTVEAQYEAILAAATHAIIAIDLKGSITEFNSAAEELFGYSRDEIQGQNISKLMAAPYKELHDGYIERYRRTGEARIIGLGREVEGRRKDGRLFPIELTVGEIKKHGLSGFVGLIRDISPQREIEEKLQQREEELEITLNRAPMAIATCDLDGDLRSANAACCRLFQASEGALCNGNLLNCVVERDRPAFRRALASLAKSETDDCQISLQFNSHADHVIHADVFMAVVHTLDNTPLFILVEFINRTAEIEAAREVAVHREQLAQVGRLGLLGEMATAIAHEINQPLTAVATYAQATRRLLENNGCERELVINTLEKITQQTSRAGAVINRIRQFTRTAPVEPTAVDTRQMLDELRELAEVDLRHAGLQLRLDVESNIGRVRGDIVQLQQVLLNLVRNAADAMRESRQGDEVRVTAEKKGRDWVRIVVDDSGPGMPPDVEKRLFEPFVSTKKDGFGLGLSICKSLIDSHGGEIEYQKSPILGGTRFTILLPVAHAPSE